MIAQPLFTISLPEKRNSEWPISTCIDTDISHKKENLR
jgi:hypothetical protein